MSLPKQRMGARPESQPKVSDLVEKLLRESDAAGVLPTPLERLFEVTKVTKITDLPDARFLEALSQKTRGAFKTLMQKLRGIADLRERATYVPRDPNARRERFAQGHELGHQVIPWHNVDAAYLDDAETLSPDAKAIFEREANFFSAEVIFQGPRFRALARDYQSSFQAVFSLADLHNASRQATSWRFVEEQDEEVALVQYYPGNSIDEHGNRAWNLWLTIASPAFSRRYFGIEIPNHVRAGNPWLAARDLEQICDGIEILNVSGSPTSFQWQAWWNGRALLVFLRRRPRLSVVSGILRRT